MSNALKFSQQMLSATKAKDGLSTDKNSSPSNWSPSFTESFQTDNGNYSNTSPQVKRRLNISWSGGRGPKKTDPLH